MTRFTDWETPQDFFDGLDKRFSFTLDVCATRENAKCPRYFSRSDDGLVQRWGGSNWMNPPYDRTVGLWVRKAYETAQLGRLVVALLQARSSETIWWHEYVMRSTELWYVKDRLHFGKNGVFSRGNISSVVVVFAPFCEGVPGLRTVDLRGQLITPIQGVAHAPI